MLLSPFLVGIDLGTTNCAVAYVDTRAAREFDRARPRRFAVPQLIAAREAAPHPVLPSFLYLGTEHDRESGALDLPWAPGAADAVGVFARDHGALTPSRLASSAKSWLAHGDVDRTAPILPFGHEAGEPGVSPLDASSRYLGHIRDAWNHEFARADASLALEAQQVVLTVPASFDDEARELTAEAASRARLAHVVLLEEPIAALYAWLTRDGRGRRGRLAADGLVLVCDVGGGTTDFSLIRAGSTSDGSGFERIAIGEHLLLGGDNLDLALAALLEERVGGPHLSLARREGLRRQASAAKERLLSDSSLDRVTVTMLGAGRSVVGGAAHATLTRDDVIDRLLNGFLPMVVPADRPAHDRRRGLRELGLPYEPDPAITRHLAAFLARGGESLARPDAVLFNGGFFAPALARQRVIDVLASWFGEAPAVLATEEPDAAVALGAAAYAALRALPDAPRDLLVRAGSPRTYYVELSSHAPADRVRALAVMPRGTDEGSRIDLAERQLRVQTNRPVAFTLWSSTTRTDPPGTLIDETPDLLHRHAPLAAVLRYGKRSSQPEVDVTLSVQFTEVGTLELWLNAPATGHRWRLQFQTRGRVAEGGESLDGEPRDEVVVADDALREAGAVVRATFAGEDAVPVAGLPAALEERIGYNKQAWPIDALRRLADVLLEVAPGRARSAAHEARWMNLVGFCVRPGFGAAADPWRVGELRKVYTAGLSFPKEVQGQVEWLVLWQRAAGGFSAGQQQELARRLVASLGVGAKKPPRLNPQIERESWRLVASLERIDPATRIRVGDALVARVVREPRNASLLWAIGRLGARVPFYGPLDRVVPPADAERWLDALVAIPAPGPDLAVAVAQLAARTGDPGRDVSPETRERARAVIQAIGAPGSLLDQLDRIALANPQEQGARYFGEDLPAGLRVTD
jgi:molecular chaperone DnaK (HSP70)